MRICFILEIYRVRSQQTDVNIEQDFISADVSIVGQISESIERCSMQLKCLFVSVIVLLGFLYPSFAQEPTLLEHGGGVRTVEFSPVDASLVASAGENNTIKLWNLRNNTARTLSGHTGIVNSVAFSPNGELLASVSDDETLKLWDVRSRQNIATLKDIADGFRWQIKSVAFSPDGQFLATVGGKHVKLWDVRKRAEIGILRHENWVQVVTFSHDGQLLASGDGSGEGPGIVKVWNVQRQQVVATLDGDPKFVKAVAFSSDNRILASSGWDGQLKLWNVSNWDLLGTIPHTGYYGIALSPDGKVLVSTNDGYVNLWSVENGENIASLPGPSGWLHPVDFSPDGTSLVVGGEDGFVRLYNIETYLQSDQQIEMVRLIYFLPSDRQSQPDIDEKLDVLIRDVQRFYANEMERHGFDRKTFEFEVDATTGKVLVHHVKGQFGDQYYYKETLRKVWKEIGKQFYPPKHVYLVAIDVGSEIIDAQWCGEASVLWPGGGKEVIIPASGHCFNVPLVAHELGHSFGLEHDFRDDAHVMSYGAIRNELSSCAAEWLDASRFLNTDQSSSNVLIQIDKDTVIEMLPPLEVPPNAIRLRFEVNDSDGLHQAQLFIPTTARDPVEGSGIKLHSCKSLSGKSSTLEFITTELTARGKSLQLNVMDVQGNFTHQRFPIGADDVVRGRTNRLGPLDMTGVIPETLQKISGDNQRGSPNKRLANPFVVAVRDSDNEPVAGVQVKFRVAVGDGKLSVTNPWTDSNGRAQTFLTLGGSRVSRVEASVASVSERVTFGTDSDPQVLIDQFQRPPMYWVDTKAGTLHRLVGPKVETLVPGVNRAVSLAVDMPSEKLYWAEKTGKRTGRIRRTNLDGTNVQLIKNLTSVPLNIALDTAGGKLYLTNAWGKIQRLNLDGSNFQPNLIRDLQSPNHLVLDVAHGKVYWTEKTGRRTGRIRRANLDGTNVELVKDLTSVPRGIAVDSVNGKIYLTNAWGKVQRLNLNGSNFQPNLITGLKSLGEITVDVANAKLYWSEKDSIRRANLNGGNIQDVVTGLGTPTGVVLGKPSVPTVTAAAPTTTVAPEQTLLLSNYPNPFNPETWIPYQLSEPAEVTLHIYAVDGTLIRTLTLGHQPAGMYHGKNRAAYWDGRNEVGESVASGVYFYTLSAGDFISTRKMLIRK